MWNKKLKNKNSLRIRINFIWEKFKTKHSDIDTFK